MEIKDLAWNETVSRRFNNPIFPKSIRGIIVWEIMLWKNHFALEFFIEAWMAGL